MKKLVAMLLALSMTFALAACGGGGSTPDAGSDGEIVLNFPCIWVATDSKAAYFNEMVTNFNTENAGKIKVVIEEQPDYQGYRDKLRTLITTGNVPDICTIDTIADIADYSESGLFADLTPYLDAGWKDDFVEGALDSFYFSDKVSILPLESAVFPIVYNTEILSECGYETFPDNYDDMMAMFKTIKDKGYNAMGQMAGENAWTSMLWYSLIVQAIGGPDVYANGLSDPAFVEAAKVLKEMYSYTFDGAVSAAASDVNGHFLARDTALYVNGPWWIANFYKEENGGLNEIVKVANNPVYGEGKGAGGAVTAVQACIAVAKQKDPAKEEAAVKFLQYITDPARITQWEASSGAMFFVKHETSPELNDIAKEFNAVLNNADFTLNTVKSYFPPAFESQFSAAVSALVLDQVDAEGFVAQLQAAIDAA